MNVFLGWVSGKSGQLPTDPMEKDAAQGWLLSSARLSQHTLQSNWLQLYDAAQPQWTHDAAGQGHAPGFIMDCENSLCIL